MVSLAERSIREFVVVTIVVCFNMHEVTMNVLVNLDIITQVKLHLLAFIPLH